MKNTMKHLVIGLAALAAISAEANSGLLISTAIIKGAASGTGADLRAADNNLFRIRPRPFENDFAFTATFSRLGNPNLINRLDFRLRGQTPFSSFKFFVFDFVSLRYTQISTVSLPAPGLSSVLLRVHSNPSRFVSSSGLLRVKIEGTRDLILDQIAVQSIQ